MGVRILEGNGEGDSQGAVLYDSVTGYAFGPVWDDADEAERFLDSLDGVDARGLTHAELLKAVRDFREATAP